MDNQVSQAPNHGENRGTIADGRYVVLHFGSLKLWNDGKLEDGTAAATASQPSNASAPTTQEASDKSLCLPENPVLDHGSLWGRNSFMTQGQELVQNHEQQSLRGLQDYRDRYVDCGNYKPEVLGCESWSKQPTMEPLYGYPSSTSKYVEKNPLFLQNSSFRPPTRSYDAEYGFNALTNNVVYTGFDYGSTSSSPNSSSLTNGCAEGCPRFDLSLLQEILKGGDSTEITMLLLMLRGSYLDLMAHKSLSLVFDKLVKACRGYQLDIVIADVLSCTQSFIAAAFCKPGASSICKLIKRVKKSSHAFSIMQVLSTQFLAIMTHEIAKSVIQSCFDCFLQKNEVLYEKAILYCQELAMDKVGCRALNEVIEKINGDQRSRLVEEIANCAGELSNHQYGNYVVQNVLSLKHESHAVVVGLRGQFVELALQQGGSHVVEKCMEASPLGLVYVVKEIVETPKASLQLAQDQFGNYVIQKALKKTKDHCFRRLYESLLKSLEPYYRELNQTMSGKIVLGILKDEVGLKWRSSANRKDGVWRLVAANKESVL